MSLLGDKLKQRLPSLLGFEAVLILEGERTKHGLQHLVCGSAPTVNFDAMRRGRKSLRDRVRELPVRS